MKKKEFTSMLEELLNDPAANLWKGYSPVVERRYQNGSSRLTICLKLSQIKLVGSSSKYLEIDVLLSNSHVIYRLYQYRSGFELTQMQTFFKFWFLKKWRKYGEQFWKDAVGQFYDYQEREIPFEEEEI